MTTDEKAGTKRTPPGLYLIAAMFALAGMASFYVFMNGTASGKTFGQSMTPLCFVSSR